MPAYSISCLGDDDEDDDDFYDPRSKRKDIRLVTGLPGSSAAALLP